MSNTHYINQEEQKLIENIHNTNYQSVENFEDELNNFSAYANNTVNNKKAINIRLLETDIQKIKAKAFHNGMPYQTLISSIIHKFANNKVISA